MTETAPLVSVCMPLYNTERFVGEAVAGVLNQTYCNLELIVCDNCSTDRSVEIVEEFARKDSRVRLIRNERNLGYAGNLHKVTSLARGEFMMVHCADDLSAPDGIEKLVRIATGPGVNRGNVMVLSDTFVTDPAGRPTGVHGQRPGGFDVVHHPIGLYVATGEVTRFRGREALAYALPRLVMVGFLGATLYSRKLFDSIEGVYNGLLYSPDCQYHYHLLSRNPEVCWLREPLFHWRLHEGGQIGLAQSQAIPKLALDAYNYTFHFSPKLLAELGTDRAQLIRTYIDVYCLRRALEEIKDGSMVLAWRHLFLALGAYPGPALSNPKFYLALAGCVTGPLGRSLARLGYRTGAWRRRSAE